MGSPSSKNVWQRAAVVALCLVIATAAAYIVRLYRLESLAQPDPTAIPRVKWMKSYTVKSALLLGKDGSLYVGTIAGLYALDSYGAVRWVHKVDLDDAITGGLVQDAEGNIYFTTSGRVYALSPEGRKRWEFECAPAFPARGDQGAVLDEHSLYVPCGQAFHVLNKENGAEQERLPAIQRNSAPALDGDMLVFFRDMHLQTTNMDGAPRWSYPPGLGISEPIYFSTPVAVDADGSIFAGGENWSIVALDKRGNRKWSYRPELPYGFTASPVIAADGTIIAVSTMGRAYAFQPDGKLKWRFQMGGTSVVHTDVSPILGEDGTIYIFSDGIYALSPDGIKRWNLSLPRQVVGEPTLAPDGTLYVATEGSSVYAVQTSSKGLMASPWPKYQHDISNSARP